MIRYIWQLPQHLLALIIIKLVNRGVSITDCTYARNVYFVNYGVFKCGISLGDYVILHKNYLDFDSHEREITIHHEIGYSKLSLYFG